MVFNASILFFGPSNIATVLIVVDGIIVRRTVLVGDTVQALYFTEPQPHIRFPQVPQPIVVLAGILSRSKNFIAADQCGSRENAFETYLHVHLIHRSEISLQARHVYVAFNNVLQAGARSFEDFGQILEGCSLFVGISIDCIACYRAVDIVTYSLLSDAFSQIVIL